MNTTIVNEKEVVVPKGPITLLMTKNGPIMIVTNDNELPIPSPRVLNATKQNLALESNKAQGDPQQHMRDTELSKREANVTNVEPKEVVKILTASATERSKSARAKMLIDGLQPMDSIENLNQNDKSQNSGIQWIKKTTGTTTLSSKSNILPSSGSSAIASKTNILTAAESERSKSIRAKRLIDSLQHDDSAENEKVNKLNKDPEIRWIKRSLTEEHIQRLAKRRSENQSENNTLSNTGTSQSETKAEKHLYSCHKCGEKFEKLDIMMKHFAVHRNERSATQPVKKLKANTNEIKIVQDASIHAGDKIFSCPTCEKIFTQKHSLLSHLLSHEREKPFSCDICERKFSHRVTLDKHKLKHFERKLDCRICGNSFSNYLAKKSHMITRHGKDEDEPEEEKFICGVCDVSFDTKIDLIQHFSEHTENDEPVELFEESFLCPYCEDVFSNRDDLIKHVDYVHDDL